MLEGISIAPDNRILLRSSGAPCEVFDFSAYYAGYFPACRFTAAARCGNLFYLAGTDGDGTPRLFSSTDGKVYAPVNIRSSLGFLREKDYGDILAILWDQGGGIPLLVTRNGCLVILPDCPRCVRARRVSERPLTGGEVRGGTVYLTDEAGETLEFSLTPSLRYRCAWPFARPHLEAGGLLVDLRSPEEARSNPLPHAHVLAPEHLPLLLAGIPWDQYLFFTCPMGLRSEDAVQEARARGFHHAYTLGSIDDLIRGNDGVFPKE